MAHNKLYRNFIILQEDERGGTKSNDKALSGYAKVEAKGDKCKVSFYAQNLSQEESYSMVLICCKRDLKQLIDLGPLVINGVGKGDTSKEYYINNIAGLGMSYEKISGAAICKVKGNETEFIMHGFMNGEDSPDNWRKFKIIKNSSSKPLEVPFEKEIKAESGLYDLKKDKQNLQFKGNIEAKVFNKDISKLDIVSTPKIERVIEVKEPEKEKLLDSSKVEEKNLNNNPNIELGVLNEKRLKEEENQISKENIDINISTFDGDRNKCKKDKKSEKHESIDECIKKLGEKMDTYDGILDFKINNLYEDVIIYGFMKNKKDDVCKWKKFKIEKKCRGNDQDMNRRPSNFKRIEENFRLDKLDDTDEPYKNDRLDIANFESYEKDIQQVNLTNTIQETQPVNLMNTTQETQPEQDFKMNGEVSKYFEKLAEGFEAHQGSLADINYCKLYKINVSSIQDLCDESDYNKYTLAYYPMLNYYPYISKSGYFLLGYKCNKNGEIQYIVYGIPGSKEKNDQPYGGRTGFVTWTMDNKNDNGYWLMFYDFKNSSIVIPTT